MSGTEEDQGKWSTKQAQDDGDGERGIWHITETTTGEIIAMTTYKKYASYICEALNKWEKDKAKEKKKI